MINISKIEKVFFFKTYSIYFQLCNNVEFKECSLIVLRANHQIHACEQTDRLISDQLSFQRSTYNIRVIYSEINKKQSVNKLSYD